MLAVDDSNVGQISPEDLCGRNRLHIALYVEFVT